jgi:2,4-dienoyl-CoA reductase-like NADH-dependent reductase (Old Yellow Enzyme family)
MRLAARYGSGRIAVNHDRWPSAAEARASLLFSPIHVGPLELRTRTWVPAMVPWRATEEGFVTPDVLRWYGRFADGEPGAIVVEATGIRDVPSGPLLRIGHDRFVPGLRALVDAVRARSGSRTRLLIQILDFLAIKRRPEKEKYVQRFLVLRDEHRAGLARCSDATRLADTTRQAARTDGTAHADHTDHDEQAERVRIATHGSDGEVRAALLALPHAELLAVLSPREREDLEYGYRERVDDLHLPHVRELPRVLPQLFADAARRAREAGFDGVELHFAHAYTLASFLSRKNERDDGYGGSREARVRLALEIVRAARAAVGSDACLGARILSDEAIAGGSTLEDSAYYAVELARAGLDFLSLSKGGKFDDAQQPKVGAAAYPYTGPSGHACMPTKKMQPHGRNLGDARVIRAALRANGLATPIVAAGGIHSFELAEHALASGACDVVAAARQSLADPDWWKKMERGDGVRVRHCLYTNYCEALDQRHVEVTCQLWDRKFDAADVDAAPGAPPRRTRDGKRRLEAPRED